MVPCHHYSRTLVYNPSGAAWPKCFDGLPLMGLRHSHRSTIPSHGRTSVPDVAVCACVCVCMLSLHPCSSVCVRVYTSAELAPLISSHFRTKRMTKKLLLLSARMQRLGSSGELSFLGSTVWPVYGMHTKHRNSSAKFLLMRLFVRVHACMFGSGYLCVSDSKFCECHI